MQLSKYEIIRLIQEWFDAYKEWAKNLAGPWLKENLDVIDFWLDEGLESEVEGSSLSFLLMANQMYVG